MPLILRGYSALLQRQIEIGARGTTLIPQRIYAAENAIWEALTGSAALGAYLPYIVPHDHGPDGGGASIPRGCIYSFDVGDDGDAHKLGVLTTTAWTRTTTRNFSFPCWPSPGVDSASTNVSAGTCYLIAKLLVDGSSTGGEVRLTNQTTGTSSTAATVTASPTWVTISDVPVQGGQWNKFDLELQQTTANVNVVRVYALSLHEIRATSQPASSGTTTYSAVTRPT